MAKKQTQQEIIEKWRDRQSMGKGQFCEAVGLSRPTLDKYLDGGTMSLEWLTWLAVDYADDWRGFMAVQLMIACDLTQYIPCTCQTAIGDNGPCPKHDPSPSPSPNAARLERGVEKGVVA